MKKVIFSLLIAVVVSVFTVSIALALPANQGTDKAKEVSPAIDENGELVAPPEFVFQPLENQLEKVVFIRYVPGKEPKNLGLAPQTTACYKFLSSSKPKWSWVENYNYSTASLGTASALAVSIWEAPVAKDIFGNGVLASYPWGVYDYKNAISFGNYSDPNVIAVTAIWFLGKNIYEYDIMFDTDYFPGGTEASYDLESVTLHELGHGAGLGDLYNSVCSSEVMYGYYQGEKMTLGSGDTTGIKKLYGSK